MPTWVETSSPNFAARFDEVDRRDVREVLNLLEDMRDRLGRRLPGAAGGGQRRPAHEPLELDLAQPYLPLVRRMTTPAARRYLAGWAARGTVHVLAPRLLAARAAKVEGSKEMLLLTPAALYVQLAIAVCNPALPPPWSPRSTLRAARWAWLHAGSAQWFSGQTELARPAIARRLREEARPEFPPRPEGRRAARRQPRRPRRARAGRPRRRAPGLLPAAARRPARGAARRVRRPRARAHRGHLARAPVAARRALSGRTAATS